MQLLPAVVRMTFLSALLYAVLLLEDGATEWHTSVYGPGVSGNAFSNAFVLCGINFSRFQLPSFIIAALACLTASLTILTALPATVPLTRRALQPLLAFLYPVGLLALINYALISWRHPEYLLLQYPQLSTMPHLTARLLHFLPGIYGLIEFFLLSDRDIMDPDMGILALLRLFLQLAVLSVAFVHVAFGSMISQDSLNFASRLAVSQTGQKLSSFFDYNDETKFIFAAVLYILVVLLFVIGYLLRRVFVSQPKPLSVPSGTAPKTRTKALAAEAEPELSMSPKRSSVSKRSIVRDSQ